jgi:hypothetical protein
MTGEVRYSVAMSLDGFIAPPDGSIARLEPNAIYHRSSNLAPGRRGKSSKSFLVLFFKKERLC